MAIRSLEALEKACENKNIYDVILEDDCMERGVTREESEKKMADLYAAIQHSAQNYTPTLRSASGMAGGDGAKMRSYVKAGKTICGEELGQVIAQALEMGENNACMKCIVAAPTAGSCGVLPAVLLPLWRSGNYNEEAICRALYVSAGFGQVVAARATLAGAEGGCQAEVGSAAAMAGAALVQMLGGTPEQALDASSIALSNLLGLVCDPVGGLVEVPCQNRNAIGVAAAFSSAQLALAGIKSLVPFDQMAHVMLSVGHALPATLRETAKGGIAQAPAALSACAKCGVCG